MLSCTIVSAFSTALLLPATPPAASAFIFPSPTSTKASNFGIKWNYQHVPGDACDSNATQNINVYEELQVMPGCKGMHVYTHTHTHTHTPSRPRLCSVLYMACARLSTVRLSHPWPISYVVDSVQIWGLSTLARYDVLGLSVMALVRGDYYVSVSLAGCVKPRSHRAHRVARSVALSVASKSNLFDFR